ncbi:T-complex protein 11 X-linked protein 2, partial [Otolemur garnettii]|uniref:T-complex protein 11 X-linked protein 2 n=1 Tax=Otolemur garnettii TaxID=30611 RepID=UPI0006444880
MPKSEETVLQNDPNEAKSGAHSSETSGKNEEEENFCLDNCSPRLMETIKEVSRMSIAHEIMVNQDFYMGENVLPPNSTEDKFMETLYNVFWNHLREQLLSNPPQFTCALELMTEVKECKYYISPYDRGIFHVLGLMKMDMANYTIQSIRPYLQEYSIQYERAKFQELLDKQPDLLDYTKKWLTQAATDVITPCPNPPDTSSSSSTACSSPNEAAENSDPPNPVMVLYQGYLNLLLWDPENEEFPETLLMDRNRVQEMGSHLRHLAILASVLLVARSFSGKILFDSPGFVDKLK